MIYQLTICFNLDLDSSSEEYKSSNNSECRVGLCYWYGWQFNDARARLSCWYQTQRGLWECLCNWRCCFLLGVCHWYYLLINTCWCSLNHFHIVYNCFQGLHWVELWSIPLVLNGCFLELLYYAFCMRHLCTFWGRHPLKKRKRWSAIFFKSTIGKNVL